MGRKVILNPTPFLVLKSRIEKFSDKIKSQLGLSEGCKVFINICTDPDMDSPKEKWIDARMNMELPMLVSECRSDVDKKGVKSAVFDCCINTRLAQECTIYRDCHEFVLEACMTMVEHQSGCVLDRTNISMPKLRVKGTPQREYEIRDDDVELSNVSEEEEEPNIISSMEEYAKEIVDSGNSDKKILSSSSAIDEKKIASAEKLISDTFDPYNIQELKIPNAESVDKSTNKIPLIEEITTSTEPIYHISRYSGPYNGTGSPPSHIIEIEIEEDVASRTQLQLAENGRKLFFGSLSIPLQKTVEKVEAYFTKDSNTLKAFIY